MRFPIECTKSYDRLEVHILSLGGPTALRTSGLRAFIGGARGRCAVSAGRFHADVICTLSCGIEFHVFNRLFDCSVNRTYGSLDWANFDTLCWRILSRKFHILCVGNNRLTRASAKTNKSSEG